MKRYMIIIALGVLSVMLCSCSGKAATQENDYNVTIVSQDDGNVTTEEEPDEESKPSYYGIWEVKDYQAAEVSALSADEMEAFRGYTVTYQADAVFCNGQNMNIADPGYEYEEYTEELLAQEYRANLGEWWNEKEQVFSYTISSDESFFGDHFFVADENILWIYYEGVFFLARKADESKDVWEKEEAEGENLSQTIEEALDSWRFEYGKIELPQVIQLLNERAVPYVGYYNQSKERLDMVLEDGTSLLFLDTNDSYTEPAEYEMMMKGNEFNHNGFQENYLKAYDVTWDEYYYPDLSERIWEENELWSFNQTDLFIARNQIFARHGRKFSDTFLDAVFSQKRWYEPVYTGEEFEAAQQELLTDIEKENLNTVMQHEILRGFRKESTDTSGSAAGLLSGSSLDLDGGGEKERIFYTITRQQTESTWNEIYKIALSVKSSSGKEIMIEQEGDNLHDKCYTASMDGEHYFLIVADNGPSADYVMNLYGYEKGEMKEAGIIYSSPQSLKVYPDRLEAMEEIYHFQCQAVNFEYIYENGQFRRQQKDYYEYRMNTATALKEISLYREKGGSDADLILSAGDEVQVMGGDLSEWVQLKKVSTGETGWLKVKGADCELSDGSSVYSENLFKGLTFYG